MRAAGLGLIPALVILCLAASSKPEGGLGHDEHNAPRLEGSWLVTVTVEGLGTWQALESYDAGGAMTASDPGAWPWYPMTGEMHGTWAKKGPRQFVFNMMNFQYDNNPGDGLPDGLMKNIVKSTLTIDNSGTKYAGNGTVWWYDSTGAVIPPSPIAFTTVATRIPAE